MPPELSVIAPCYNEAEALSYSMPPLLAELDRLGVPFELLLVDNGSSDGTGKAIDALAAVHACVRRVDVALNRGYGAGVRAGLAAALGNRLAFLGADGQVPAGDVGEVLRRALSAPPGTLVKALRRTRGDGLLRWTVSRGYNLLYGAFLPVSSRDLNATPKVLHRSDLEALALSSDDWFLDAECMIRAGERGLAVVEVPVRFLPREAGRSHVRPSDVVSFLRHLLAWRRTGRP